MESLPLCETLSFRSELNCTASQALLVATDELPFDEMSWEYRTQRIKTLRTHRNTERLLVLQYNRTFNLAPMYPKDA